MQFTRLPFGLATSGSIFYRTLERILRRDESGLLLHNIAELYCDDGCINTAKGQDHIDAIAWVLKQLRRNNAPLKLAKPHMGH